MGTDKKIKSNNNGQFNKKETPKKGGKDLFSSIILIILVFTVSVSFFCIIKRWLIW